MKGIQTMFVKDNTVGLKTRFGPNWPGKRCGAKTRTGNHCRRPAYKHNGRCSLHGGLSTGPKTQSGRDRISKTNLNHGKFIKSKLTEKKQEAMQSKKIKYELDMIENLLIEKGIIDQKWNY